MDISPLLDRRREEKDLVFPEARFLRGGHVVTEDDEPIPNGIDGKADIAALFPMAMISTIPPTPRRQVECIHRVATIEDMVDIECVEILLNRV